MEKLIFDKESESFVREALGFKEKESDSHTWGYVTVDEEVKELNNFSDMIEFVL